MAWLASLSPKARSPTSPVSCTGIFLDLPPNRCTADLLDSTSVDVFFARLPVASRLFQQARFRHRLNLIPRHPDFPAVCVLCAICCCTARLSGLVYTAEPIELSDDSWPSIHDDPQTVRDFGRRYMLLARHAIDDNIARGQQLYESAQATCLLMAYYYNEARWLEAWNAVGQLSRLIIPLGLLSPPLAEKSTTNSSRHMGRTMLLPPSTDSVDREERRALLWTAVFWDVTQSQASGLPGTLPVDEIVCISFPADPRIKSSLMQNKGVPLPCFNQDFCTGVRYLFPLTTRPSLLIHLTHPRPKIYLRTHRNLEIVTCIISTSIYLFV